MLGSISVTASGMRELGSAGVLHPNHRAAETSEDEMHTPDINPSGAGTVAARPHGVMLRLAAGRRIATAESCTAGRIASLLAAEVGASEFLLGGLVAYHETTKRELLHVSAPCIYSEEAAAQMAVGICELTGAQLAVSTTGLAGPEPIEGVAPGTVWIATRVDGQTSVRTYRFDGTEPQICERAAEQALDDLLAALGHSAASHDPEAGITLSPAAG